eukprot:7385030-Pyramimonas_sp.AAC.1
MPAFSWRSLIGGAPAPRCVVSRSAKGNATSLKRTRACSITASAGSAKPTRLPVVRRTALGTEQAGCGSRP